MIYGRCAKEDSLLQKKLVAIWDWGPTSISLFQIKSLFSIGTLFVHFFIFSHGHLRRFIRLILIKCTSSSYSAYDLAADLKLCHRLFN